MVLESDGGRVGEQLSWCSRVTVMVMENSVKVSEVGDNGVRE
jgi:hypothetical protein